MQTQTSVAGDTSVLLEDAKRALAQALSLGADDATIRVDQGQSTEYAYRDGQLERVQDSGTKVLSAAIYVDGRYSGHQSNDLRTESLDAFFRDAVELTRALEPDPHRRLPDPALYEGRTDLDLAQWDDQLLAIGRPEFLAWLEAMDASTHVSDEVISSTSQVSVGHGAMARVTSNGFEGAQRSTSITGMSEVTVRDEGDKRPEAYAYKSGRKLADIGDPVAIAEKALRRALLRRGSAKAASVRTKMILHRESAGGLLGRICGALSGVSIQQGRSFLGDKLDQSIASPLLSITDDPWLVGALSSRAFDGEGLATAPRAIIEAGVLKAYFVGSYYANKLDWQPTTGGPSNLVFAPGDKDAAGLLAEADEGIYVTAWAGGNADMTTGDFSFGIRGFQIRDGKIAEPISEMNITGNYLELLPRLIAVGNDPYVTSSIRTPTLVFDDVQFSGS